MRNENQKAKEFYVMEGIPSNCETQIIKTGNGNFVYRHFISGNSPQPTRAFYPKSGDDIFMNNENYFHYLSSICRMKVDVQTGFLLGKEIADSFRKKINKIPTVGACLEIY